MTNLIHGNYPATYIPDDKIVEFEHSLLTIGQLWTLETRPGLRDRTTLKSTFHPDYILNA